MAKKPYDVTERFQEVARRAREVNTGPSKKKVDTRGKSNVQPDTTTFPTRPGAKMKKTGDVNLSAGPSFMKKK